MGVELDVLGEPQRIGGEDRAVEGVAEWARG